MKNKLVLVALVCPQATETLNKGHNSPQSCKRVAKQLLGTHFPSAWQQECGLGLEAFQHLAVLLVILWGFSLFFFCFSFFGCCFVCLFYPEIFPVSTPTTTCCRNLALR